MKKNEVIVDFVIADFNDITHEEITRKIGINPIKVYVKGEKRNPRNPKSTALLKNNRWVMGSSLDKYSSFEDQMNALLNIIEPKIELFRPFCAKYYCEFSCAVYIYFDNEESTPWVHLNARYNKLITELNIEFDVDLYCLPKMEE